MAYSPPKAWFYLKKQRALRTTGGGLAGPSLLLAGVNLPGAEFGSPVIPGTLGSNYFYPSNGDIDYFVASGATCIRIPFFWERIQIGYGGALRTADISELDRAVARITSQGAYALLDVHNYFRYLTISGDDTSKKIIGAADGPTIAQFVDLWSKLATRYKSDSKVVFGLMNEPFDTELAGTPAGTYPTMIATWNAAIAAIRAAGAANLITVPGSEYTGAHSLVNNGSAAALLNVTDPLNNFWIEVHQYLDSNDSGTYGGDSFSDVVVGKGATVLAAVTSWARTNRKRLLVGEFGAPPTTAGLAELKAMHDFMAANADVWRGWTAWAASGFDDFYGLKYDPYDSSPTIDRPQWTLARRYIPTATPMALTISVGTRSAPITGAASSFKIYAEGGLPPYTFAVQSGSLATGYSLTTNNISEGVVSGTPSAAGSYSAVVRVTDAAGATADVTVASTVVAGGNPNVLPNPQTFSNASWTKSGVTITEDATTAPDGTTTADKMVNSVASLGQVYRAMPGGTLTSGQSYVFSCYAKAAEYSAVLLNVYDNVSDKGVLFNLGAGTTSNRPGGGTEGASGVIDAGNGWKRCWFTFVAEGTTGNANIYMQNPGAIDTGPYAIGNGLYIWGAKLEQASTLSTYPP